MIKKQNGLTLIELMIGMTLGLTLVAGITQIFIQLQKNFTLQRNLSDMMDDATFILDTLTKGIYQAGYSEDGKYTAFAADSNVLSSTLNFAQNEYIHGSDSEFIYRFQLSDSLDLNNFICNSPLTYNKGDVVAVRIYKDLDSSTPKVPVFYCKVKQGSIIKNAEPLVSEVEKLVFEFGIHDKTTNTFYYANAADVANWTNVATVKMYIVLRSADDKLTHSKVTYNVKGVTYTATDNRLYKVFSKTVYLRGANH